MKLWMVRVTYGCAGCAGDLARGQASGCFSGLSNPDGPFDETIFVYPSIEAKTKKEAEAKGILLCRLDQPGVEHMMGRDTRLRARAFLA